MHTRMTTAAYGYFAAHGGGRIAVVSSIAGTRGLGVAAADSASKRFQNPYIDSLAQLARMQGSKIRFTDIARINEQTLSRMPQGRCSTLEQYRETDAAARETALSLI